SHLLDGAVMLPGATLSFNAVVGKREPARGFAPALELLNGELTQGVGGGVCQVAGTLHAAAFFAGLTVEEYHAHSRMNRLAYLPPGLDAMVAWPDNVRELRDTKDMRLSNPYPFPIVVKSQSVHSGSQNVLRVQLYGATSPYRVEFQFKELAREPAPEVQRPAPMLPVGEVRLLQPPLDGLVIRRRRTIYTPLRRIDEETRIAYPPNPRIVSVGTKL
ncbi:MAG TPA: VanW family protein, partial [Polyangiales bacterium]|nr:VanW family protein [Polyangiales bacterium]